MLVIAESHCYDQRLTAAQIFPGADFLDSSVGFQLSFLSVITQDLQ
jgi:hypothetical protein